MTTASLMATIPASRRSKVQRNPPRRHERLLALLLIPITVGMVCHTLGYILRPLSPDRAVLIDPANAEVNASRAEQLLRSGATADNLKIAGALAERALMRSPVSAAGARTLAAVQDAEGHQATALRLIEYSESVSRRDLPTQVALIERAVARNDIPTALRHYDIALRTSEVSRALLFPVLIEATSHHEIARALQPILVARPLWADAFLTEASQKTTDLAELAYLLIGIIRAGYPVPEPVLATSVQRLISSGDYSTAQSLYAAVYPDRSFDGVRDSAFRTFGAPHTAFDWEAFEVDGLLAEPVDAQGIGALRIQANSGVGGTVGRELLMLGSGNYRVRSSLARAVGTGVVTLRFSCAERGDRLAEIRSPTRRSSTFGGVLTIPTGCTAQWLEIAVDSGDEPMGFDGELGPIRLSRLPGDRLPGR